MNFSNGRNKVFMSSAIRNNKREVIQSASSKQDSSPQTQDQRDSPHLEPYSDTGKKVSKENGFVSNFQIGSSGVKPSFQGNVLKEP